ncbi:hypothetical protein LOZ66_001262 [Ophidiomyces ophidiicola]|nr:hypothetical protein LOZ66_001262 [Ophidiomyces ophidiicola]
MEVPDCVGPEPQLTSGPTAIVIPDGLLSDDINDDGRSSSLSEIDERLDDNQLDELSPIRERFAGEIDSEAETERIEDSPHRPRDHINIVASAAISGASPSKLAQSTTYDDMDEDEGVSPSKPPRDLRANGVAIGMNSNRDGSASVPLEITGKKRKRGTSTDNGGETPGDDEPMRKRRSSVPDCNAEATTITPSEPTSKKNNTVSNDETPANGDKGDDSRPSTLKGRKGKKGKRKGKKTKDTYDDTEDNGQGEENVANGDDQLVDEEENADGVDGTDDPEAASRMEESLKKTSAMDVLLSLEKQFAALRDKIYDDRIASINDELAQLEKPTPTHPEFLRQLRIIENYRDEKMKHEEKLFSYKLRSICIRSQAERSQVNSSYFQNSRDTRERYLQELSEHHYRVQHDRFNTGETITDYRIPFPTQRVQQAAQLAAYNTEVGILSGTAKYVGFPSAPDMESLRPHEIEQDFIKLGISLRSTIPAPLPSVSFPQHNHISSSSAVAIRQAAEEEFIEQTPWANPQHPIHEQFRHQMQQDRIPEYKRYPNNFSTPAAQLHAVDLNVPNGSASMIPDPVSAPSSSTAHTPYNYDRPRRNFGLVSDKFTGRHVEIDDNEGHVSFRSLSASPLDVRRSHPSTKVDAPQRSPAPSVIGPMGPPNSSRDVPISPSASTARAGRLGLATREEQSRASSPKQTAPIFGPTHQSAGITIGGSERFGLANP